MSEPGGAGGHFPRMCSARLAGFQPSLWKQLRFPTHCNHCHLAGPLPTLKPKGSIFGQLDVIVLSGTLSCGGEIISYHLVPIFYSQGNDAGVLIYHLCVQERRWLTDSSWGRWGQGRVRLLSTRRLRGMLEVESRRVSGAGAQTCCRQPAQVPSQHGISCSQGGGDRRLHTSAWAPSILTAAVGAHPFLTRPRCHGVVVEGTTQDTSVV